MDLSNWLEASKAEFEGIEDPGKRVRVQRALLRHGLTQQEWHNTVYKLQKSRFKSQKCQKSTQIRSPNRTLIELQANFIESFVPQELQESVQEKVRILD